MDKVWFVAALWLFLASVAVLAARLVPVVEEIGVMAVSDVKAVRVQKNAKRD